jgi:hypothetical protein
MLDCEMSWTGLGEDPIAGVLDGNEPPDSITGLFTNEYMYIFSPYRKLVRQSNSGTL